MNRQQTEAALGSALERGEFRLFYQPILRLRRETLVGFEALLRWEHPDHGLLLPDAFIPIAEETGLIVPMGRWVLREACRQLSAWQNGGRAIGHLRVAVNLSSREFQESDLVGDVGAVLAEFGLAGQQLEIEITESTAMSDIDAVAERLSQFSAAGISISLDDFGAGYSSLAHLHRLPVNRLKIDRSFVARLGKPGNDSVPIVEAVLAMGRNLGIDVVAEGVDCVTQLDALCALNCQLGQGFLFSRPVDADAAMGVLRDGFGASFWQTGQGSLLPSLGDAPLGAG